MASCSHAPWLNAYVHAALPFGRPVLVVAHSCVTSWWRAVHETDPVFGDPCVMLLKVTDVSAGVNVPVIVRLWNVTVPGPDPSRTAAT